MMYYFSLQIFTAAISDLSGEVQQLKEDIRIIASDIDLSESTWKTITHSLDKSEYIFNRLIDEIIDENNSYLDVLEAKKVEHTRLVEEAQKLVIKLEQKKVYCFGIYRANAREFSMGIKQMTCLK